MVFAATSRSQRTSILRAMLGWAAILLGLVAVAYSFALRWTPSKTDFAQQGPMLNDANGTVNWPQLAASNPDFVYLVATTGAQERSTEFARNRDAAVKEAIPYGVGHHYSMCEQATDQSTNFDTFVPRDPAALPPVVILDFDAACRMPPTRALIISELTTFLNQIEAHMGKPAIVSPSPEFEERYRISSAINRTLWLRRNFFVPDYAARPWVMWQANAHYRAAGVTGAVRWNVMAGRK